MTYTGNVSRSETATYSGTRLLEENTLSLRKLFLDEGEHFLFGVCIDPAMFVKTFTVSLLKQVYLGLDLRFSFLYGFLVQLPAPPQVFG